MDNLEKVLEKGIRMERNLYVPYRKEKAVSLRAGDMVYISGTPDPDGMGL